MQAVIALCHFCENHGPRVVMTCQPMRDYDKLTEHEAAYGSSSSAPNPSTSMPSTSANARATASPISKKTKSYNDTACSTEHARPSKHFHYGNCVRESVDNEERCKACSSFSNGPCLLSNDHPSQVSYISSEVALHQRVYDRVKNACLRSLSCEITSLPKSTPAPSNSSSSTSTARPRMRNPDDAGPSSTPAMTIGGHRNVTQQNSNELFDPELLPDAKARGFMRLFSLIAVTNDLTVLTNNFDYFKNALGALRKKLQILALATYEKEMREAERITEDDVMRPEYASMVGRMPRWFRRKIAIDTDRNLVTITSDPHVWVILHRFMMWTLRSLTLTCRDQILEGKPTQDMLVSMELDQSQIVELQLTGPNQQANTLAQLANLKWIAGHMETCAEPGDFDLLLNQIVTGGQVICEAAEKTLCSQFFLAISNLLPLGCLRMATYRDCYLPEYSTSFNLVGGPIGMDVPLDVPDVMILAAIGRKRRGENDKLSECTLEVLRRPERNEKQTKYPQIVQRYKDLLMDVEVVDKVLDSTLRTTREFWLSKAKICYQMHQQNSETSFFQVVQVIKNIALQDQQVLFFWQAGLSNNFKETIAGYMREAAEDAAAEAAAAAEAKKNARPSTAGSSS